MGRRLIERRLVGISTRLQRLQEELAIANEQLGHFAGEADDARIRSLVSETPVADRDYRDAQRHADAMRRHRDGVVAEIGKLQRNQDQLLDQLAADR